jgi:glycosyltransferase involved in cell wall biosynthesis
MSHNHTALITGAQLRIGVAWQGDPTDPAAWSGTLRNLIAGLEGCGLTVRTLRAEIPVVARVNRHLRRSFSEVAGSRLDGPLNSVAARRAISRAGQLEGVVQVGSGYLLPRGVRTVTWEDMTVAQAVGMPDGDYTELRASVARRWKERQQRIYERAYACCVTSHWARDSIVQDYGIPPETVHVVGFGHNARAVDVQRDWTSPRFLFVGRQWERKNGPRVLRAFARLREEVPAAQLDLVGGHPPIEEGGVVGHGTLRFGIPADRERYATLVREATCLVMPSLYEPFGVAHLDAGATGMPSIGSTVGGAVEAIGEGGMLVDPGNDEALLAAMRRMCDPEAARAMGAAAQRVSARFTWPLVAQRVVRALEPPGVDLATLAPFVGEEVQ